MIRRLAVSIATAGTLALVAVPAQANSTIGCTEIGVQVAVAAGDPSGLDKDGDGIGCEAQVGPPVQQNPDLSIGEFPGQFPTPGRVHELAHTGASDMIHRHPVRTIGAAAGIVVLGGALYISTRKKKPERKH